MTYQVLVICEPHSHVRSRNGCLDNMERHLAQPFSQFLRFGLLALRSRFISQPLAFDADNARRRARCRQCQVLIGCE